MSTETVAKPKQKPMKIGEERVWDVGGTSVMLRKVEPTTRQYDFEDEPVKEQKARYEIYVKGAHYGFINCGTGFGSDWHIEAFGKTTPHAYDFEMEKAYVVYPHKYTAYTERVGQNRDTLVQRIPEMIEDGLLLTREALKKRLAEKRALEKREKIEAAARHKQREAEWAALRKAEDERRADILKGLQSIRVGCAFHLTNSQIDALEEAMKLFQPKPQISMDD